MAAESGLYVLGLTAQGKAHLTVRRPDGSWRAFEEVPLVAGDTAALTAVAAGGFTGDSSDTFFSFHACAATADGRLLHARTGPDGLRPPLADIEPVVGDRGEYTALAALKRHDFPEGPGPFTGLSVHGVTAQARVFRTDRDGKGQWGPLEELPASTGYQGGVVALDIAASASATDSAFHLVAVTGNGRLLHTYTNGRGTDVPFYDVEGPAGERGDFRRAACAAPEGHPEQLHLCGVTADGRLWHALHVGAFSLPFPFPGRRLELWTQLGDVEGQAGERGSVRHVACRTAGQDLHVCAVTADGRLWHALRRGGDGTWTSFGDVEGQAGERGQFVQVALSEA
ncbi:hypothetical protein [Streptomyces torulosus]|uniref:hypothetical protein n=1 Tax=Streptomyces torulosus TaxID=68276 RepID=UPI0006EB280C|nr:hypothetical protein [Streptomyces torulosus]